MKLQERILLLAFGLFLSVGTGFSQDSSSKPSASPASAPGAAAMLTGPGGTLKDILAAACSQSQNDFTRYLTARNKEAFSRMTPSARVALMKRFVLLNEPGKAKVSINYSGRPVVRCIDNILSTKLLIGGAYIHGDK